MNVQFLTLSLLTIVERWSTAIVNKLLIRVLEFNETGVHLISGVCCSSSLLSLALQLTV